jgi:hypothetical protein
VFDVALVTAPRPPKAASQAGSPRRCGDDVLRPSPAILLARLDARSLAVLELLVHEPVLTTHHIRSLVFTDGTDASRAELCRRTLRRLTCWGLLYRARATGGRTGGGSRPSMYTLTAAGDRLLALRDGRSPTRRRPADASTALRAHQLAIADIQVALVVAGRAVCRAVRWQGEPRCWWEFISSEGRELLKPDGYAEVDLPGLSRLAWFEVDRGSQSVPTTIAGKVRRYCRAAQAKAAAGESIPLVVFVVVGTERRRRIASQLERWASRERLPGEAAARLLRVVPPDGVVPLILDANGMAR